MKFQNKVAFITGVAKGIGRAIALGMAKDGADLVLCDINENGLNETANLAKELGVKVKTALLDVSDEEGVNKTVQEALAEFGHIDILINNAGIYNTWEHFVDSKPTTWKQKINVNILGTMYPTYAILPSMLKQKYGRIINIASVAGVFGIANFVDYSMTKGAIIAFTKALAKETTAEGVTVNAVSPGMIQVDGCEPATCDANYIGRRGTSEECASMVLFLATDEAGYVSGQNIQVDGCRKKM